MKPILFAAFSLSLVVLSSGCSSTLKFLGLSSTGRYVQLTNEKPDKHCKLLGGIEVQGYGSSVENAQAKAETNFKNAVGKKGGNVGLVETSGGGVTDRGRRVDLHGRAFLCQ